MLRMKKRATLILRITLSAVMAIECLYFAISGDIPFPDEGFYLAAARMVTEGNMLYCHFPYFQAPLLPFIYGILLKPFGYHFLQGRVLSVFFSVIMVWILILIGERLGGVIGAAVAGVFTIASTFLIHVLSSVAAYSQPAMLVFVSILYLQVSMNRQTCGLRSTQLKNKQALVSSALGAILVGIRSTFLPIVLILLYPRRKAGFAAFTRSYVPLVIFSIVIWTPGFITCPKKVWFQNFIVHSKRASQMPLWQDLNAGFHLGNAIRVTGSLLVHNFPLLSLIILLLAFSRAKGLKDSDSPIPIGNWVLASSVHFFVHLAPVPIWEVYFLPLLVMLISALARRISVLLDRKAINKGTAFLLICLVAIATFHLNGGLTFLVSKPTHLSRLSEIADYLSKNTSDGDEIFTFMTPIAIEADRLVMPKAEMSFFAWFPAYSKKRAQEVGIFNTEMIIEFLLSEQCQAVVLTDLCFEQGVKPSPNDYQALMRVITGKYFLAAVFDNFYHTRVFLPKRVQLDKRQRKLLNPPSAY